MYSDILRKVKRDCILHDVMLELTYDCNLDCFFCYNDKKATGARLNLEQYINLLDDLVEMQTLNVTLTGGEPLLHPHFFEIGKAAWERGFVVRIKTGGHGLGGRLARRVKKEINPFVIETSLHGATAEVHDQQTRVAGSFDYLVKNIPELNEMGLRVMLISALTKWNENQVAEMFALADALGVVLRFQGPVVPRDNGDEDPLQIQPSANGWKRFGAIMRQRSEQAGIECVQDLESGGAGKETPDDTPYCGTGSDSVLIDPFGNVYPCLRMRNSAGDLHKQSIQSIWRGAHALTEARDLAIQTSSRIKLVGTLNNMGGPLFCPGLELMGCKTGCGGCG